MKVFKYIVSLLCSFLSSCGLAFVVYCCSNLYNLTGSVLPFIMVGILVFSRFFDELAYDIMPRTKKSVDNENVM